MRARVLHLACQGGGSSPPARQLRHMSFDPFVIFRTIWKESRYYQFDWVCAAHLECRSLVLKNARSTGI